MTGITIFSINIITISPFILILLYIEVSESTVIILKINIIIISLLLYIIIGIIMFNIGNITILLLFTFKVNRVNIVNIINIIIEKSDINKAITLLLIYINIIIP